METRRIILVAVVVLVAIYISYYYTYPSGMSILQTSLGEFSLDLLREKQPLVIQDRISDTEQLRKAWFPYSITTRFQIAATETPEWHRNPFKYLLIQAQASPATVYLSPQKTKMLGNEPDPETTVLAGIQLAPLQCVIIPRKAYYATQSDAALACLGVNDYVSYFLP